jgi:hypothetical protein
MTDYAEIKKLTIDDLLIRAILQGNGASRQEIQSRQMAIKPCPKLGDFLLDELLKGRGVTKSITQSEPGGDLNEIDISDDPDETCLLARRMVRDGFQGQGMKDQPRAAAYINLAADNPRVMNELPDSGKAFWKSAEFHYRLWKKQRDQS